MSEENGKIIPFNEEVNLERESQSDDEKLKAAVEEQLSKVRVQAMLLGCQVTCQVVLDKIMAMESQPGKHSLNDYKRLVKDVKQFCVTGLSRKVNPDGTTSPKDENNTKLMEEGNEGNVNESDGESNTSN